MSGGDPGQMANQGGFYNQGPPPDAGIYNQAPPSGQEWFSQPPGGGQPVFFNPSDYPKTQPAVFNPYNPGEPPPAQGNVIPEGPGGQQVNNQGFPEAPKEPQQAYGQPFYGDSQYAGEQWNSAQQNNGVPQQQPSQPLNGANHVDSMSANQQPWSQGNVPGLQHFTDYNQAPNTGIQSGLYQPYENNNAQQQAGQPGSNYGEYAYSDDNDSHKGFGSFYHGEDSDVLASSGTPSLSASERQTPDHALSPAATDDPRQSVSPHSSEGQSQVQDHILQGADSYGQQRHYQPGVEPQQFAVQQQPFQPPVSHPSDMTFYQGQAADQVPTTNTDSRIFGGYELSHNSNQTDPRNTNHGLTEPNQNRSKESSPFADQPVAAPTFGQSQQIGISSHQPDSNFARMRNDASVMPSPLVPSSEGGYQSSSSDSLAPEKTGPPVLPVQRSPSIPDDQMSSHSQGSLRHSGSVSSQSLPPSTSTSRSNSMLGEQPGHPSLSPVSRDTSLGSASPGGAAGSPVVLQGSTGQGSTPRQIEQSESRDANLPPDSLDAASIEQSCSIQNGETIVSDPSPQISSVAPLYQNQQSQPERPTSSPRNLENEQQPPVEQSAPQPTIPNLNLGQGSQFQQDSGRMMGEMSVQPMQNEPPVSSTVSPVSVPNATTLTQESKLDASVQPGLNQSALPAPADSAPTSLPPTGLPKLSASQMQRTVPQGPKELSPTDESPSTHHSAFRSVQRGTLTSVNPSPPLWSAEVPPMPANILLAPAAPPTASLVPPVRLTTPQNTASTNLAASVASVSVPSLPAEAVSLLTQPAVNSTPPNPSQPISASNTNPSHPNMPSQTPASTTQASGISQVTQNMGNLNLDPTQNPVLTHPIPPVPGQPVLHGSSSAPQANKATESVVLASSAPSLASQAAMSAAPGGGSAQTSVSSAPSHIPSAQAPGAVPGAQQNQTAAVQQPQQSGTGVGGEQHFQQQQQQQQQQLQQQQQQQPALPMQQQGPAYGQPQTHQGQFQQQGQPPSNQWYDRRSSDPYYDRQYYDQRYPYDYRSQHYDYYARQAAYDRQRAYAYKGAGYDANRSYSRQGYSNQERPRSRQGYPNREKQGYPDQERQAYPDRERPRSRQGYQDQSKQGTYPDQEDRQRPRSRQERGYGADAYNRGYEKRDSKDYYRGYDAYGRPYDKQAQQEYWAKQGYYANRSYDDRYQNWERQSQYYRDRGDENQQRQNTSAPEQQWPAESQTGREGYQDGQGNTSFASEFHHQGGDTPEKYSADQSSIYTQDYSNQNTNSSMGYRDQYGSSYGYKDGTDGVYQEEVKQVTPPPLERLTPAKFALPHIIARFSPGGHLVKVLPNMPQDGMPARVEIHSIETMLEHTAEAEELRAFPGPLIKGETHKNDVISFCNGKSTACKNSTDTPDRESASLLWDLMELVCRQNGNIMESDVSDLLLKNHPMVTSPSSSATPASQTGGEEAAGEETNSEGQRAEVTAKRKPQLRDVESDTSKFRELLLFGRKKDALEAAMKAGLWGHALLLACKMDSRTHTSVMTRFANSLPMNDPLQTLYQLMSDRQPAAVTSCADEKWGDWRPHLAMILSNLSQDSELDMKSIITLGDSLASRGLLKASHFVYLMAQVGFGVYSKRTNKMVLLGASHSLPFKLFALNESIQQTEIYEYAQLLCNKQYTLPNYQPYKFIYATRLAEHGLTTQALSYCEVVANAVVYMPSLYSTTLVTQIYQLASRLIYHDERYSDGRETAVPDWLNRLQDILNQMNEGQILPSSSSGTPMPWVESYSNLSTVDSGGSVESTGPTFEVPSSEGKEPYTAVGDYTLTASGYYQPAASTAGSANDPTQSQPNAYSYDQQQQQQQQQLPEENTEPMTQYPGSYTTFGQRHKPLSSLPQNLDPGASLNSNYSEYSTTSLTSAGESGTEFEESGASKAAFDYYAASTRTGSFSQYGATQAGNPPSPADTLTPPATPGGRTRNYSADSTKQPQREETNQSQTRGQGKAKGKTQSQTGRWSRLVWRVLQ
ncbi:protein transport protein Sec16A-like [Patiria miniata]|uniref:Protein transport protein sec16 n=1 Tax=Patiria miniata TaxID=46514 RepID=A0A913Z3M8_PATMI|nr:protein transport protein Sec16A-like [Patiria miniata]